MTTKYKGCRTVFFILMLLISFEFSLSGEDSKWVIAALKFTPDNTSQFDQKSETIVNSTTGEMLPIDILENIGKSVVRNVIPDELFERTKYKLKSERQSLFLQLSSEYKKRDSLVLSNYSDFSLKTAIKEEDKKIESIQKKIDENLKSLKEETEKNQQKMAKLQQSEKSPEEKEMENDSEFKRYKNLLVNWFNKNESLITYEQVTFYKDDYQTLYTPPEAVKGLSPSEPLYSDYVTKAGINSLITGHFKKYGDYISVYVDVYEYPSGKKSGSLVDVGNVNDLELVTTDIALQLLPILSNSQPSEIEFSITPQEVAADVSIFIDDILQKDGDGKITIDSGVHSIQFVCQGYKTAGTSYYFEGNKKYKIEVNLEKPKYGYLQVELKKPMQGDILMNGERALEIDGKKAQIAINGNKILGEFISENGDTAFFYVPEKLTFDGSLVKINPKPMDRMAYIDKRRKIMYASYSIFMISLIPAFYTHANFENYAHLYANYQTQYEVAKNWQTASNVSRLVSIGCGIFWGYELIRYLIAANSVLPQNARAGNLDSFVLFQPDEELSEATGTAEATETAEATAVLSESDAKDKKTENTKTKNGDKKK